MNIRKYYMADVAEGGGPGDPKKAPVAPKGYAVTTPQQREEWNGFLDSLDKQGIGGKPDLDQPGAGLKYLQQYKKTNPKVSLTPEQVQNIQYEQYQIRKGEQFGKLNKMQLEHLRSGLSPAYLERPTSDVNGEINAATSKLYYPAGKAYGTDIENYDAVPGQSGTPPAAPQLAGNAPPSSATPPAITGNGSINVPGGIPKPDYKDATSRLQYAQSWKQKYGPLMQERGDTPLRVNDTPQFGKSTSKEMSSMAATKLGIDPALLYSSAMEEGMSGSFADLKGEYKYDRSGQSDKFPVNSSSDFGLDQVRSEIKRFQAKGYLPADFQKHYANAKHAPGEMGSGNKPVTQNDVDLDTPESAMLLKAAYLKDNYDTVDKIATEKGLKLSPQARDFFTLVAYNAGSGVADRMLKDYNKNGYLKDDAFMKSRPTKGEGLSKKSYGPTYDKNGKQIGDGVYTNVIRRIQMRDALKKEKLFD